MKSEARSRDLWLGIGVPAMALLVSVGLVVYGAPNGKPCRPGPADAKPAPCAVRMVWGVHRKPWLILVLDRMITITTHLAV